MLGIWECNREEYKSTRWRNLCYKLPQVNHMEFKLYFNNHCLGNSIVVLLLSFLFLNCYKQNPFWTFDRFCGKWVNGTTVNREGSSATEDLLCLLPDFTTSMLLFLVFSKFFVLSFNCLSLSFVLTFLFLKTKLDFGIALFV